MATAATSIVSGSAKLLNFAGPIFDKELRVSSRRRRNYVIRSIYILLLLFILSSFWFSMSYQSTGSSANRISRMAEVGKGVIVSVAWFQFLTVQIIAVVMLSNSISDEIRRGTLDALMTTPISNFQIVVGKLCSGLVQLVLLMAVTLPVLAIVRVMGGIEWGYLIASSCITFFTVLLTGSLTIFLSIRNHRPYSVIFTMLILLVAGYFCSFIFEPMIQMFNIEPIMQVISPFYSFIHITSSAYSAMGVSAGPSLWYYNCLFMFGLSMILLALSVWRIRKDSRHRFIRAKGRPITAKLKRLFTARSKSSDKSIDSNITIRQVKGPPVIFRELGRPLSKSILRSIIFALLLLILIVPLGLFFSSVIMGPWMFSFVCSILWLIAFIRTGTMASVCIAKEKEARTLPVLLGTTLTDWQIIRGKAAAILCRNMSLWLVLALIVIITPVLGLMTGMGMQSFDEAIVYACFSFMVMLANILYLVGAGMYFSIRIKATTAAVVATLGLAIVIYITQQLVSSIFAFMIMSSFAGSSMLPYRICQQLYAIILFGGFGLFMLWRTKARLRRNIF